MDLPQEPKNHEEYRASNSDRIENLGFIYKVLQPGQKIFWLYICMHIMRVLE